MSAHEHLNQQQFMPVHEVMKHWGMAGTPDGLREYEGEYQKRLTEHMRTHGFWGHVELTTMPNSKQPMIWDGHHRLLAAHDLGMTEVPVKHEPWVPYEERMRRISLAREAREKAAGNGD